MIKRRVETGTLHRVYRGVYRVGHTAPSMEARYLAAVLAAGEGALLTGKAVAHLMRLSRGQEPRPEVVARSERRIKLLGGMPLLALLRATTVLYRTQPEDVEAVLARYPNAPGATTLRRILRGDTKTTLSNLERHFIELLKTNRLALPETNKLHNGRYLDCRWPEQRLTIELDSYRYHATRHAWERDRQREREARRRGDDFRRFTSRDVFDRPDELLGELRPLLRAA